MDPLPPAALRKVCDPERLPFETTTELEPADETVGQERAIEALRFGVGIQREGYGLFVLGPQGTGRHTTVLRYLRQRAADRAAPSDWCYVHRFDEPHAPRALCLPAGRGTELRDDMAGLVEDLRAALPAAFESEDYRTRRESIVQEFKERHERAFEPLRRRAEQKDVVLIRTPDGLALAPTRNGAVLGQDEFARLPEAEQQQIEADLAELRSELKEVVKQIPKWGQEQRDRLRRLDREVTALAVGHLIEALRDKYAALPEVLEHFRAVQDDVVENAHQFLQADSAAALPLLLGLGQREKGPGDSHRYGVNLLVDHSKTVGAPVVFVDQPDHHHLIGRIEHVSQLGALVTDFRLIKAGALHRANGGYLVVDAEKLLVQPFAYDELKRTLRSKEIRIESLADRLSLVSTVSLEPEPIPLDVKVVLVGERRLYYLLCELDPEFRELFKVPVDFDDRMERSTETTARLVCVLAAFTRNDRLRPLRRDAVARLIEHASRLVDDQQKLTTRLGRLCDLVREADYWAAEDAEDLVRAEHVERAIDAQIRRSDRLRERVHELVLRGTVLIDSRGSAVGQVNGLSVFGLGGFAFGAPTRITARVRTGKGDVVDIEREVDLGGPIHSKGVLILAGFLGQRYAGSHPLCLSASLVFEQSYAGVEGDSASSAELFALLSALSRVPLRQSIAVTGSVNQHGQVQAIGGVNEKIEGFFDVCSAAGLTGDQGVLIPAANVENLMLRDDVVRAVDAGQFWVWAIDHVDQGIEILTGQPAGALAEDGLFAEGSVNRLVQERLRGMAERVRRFAERGEGGAS